MSLLEKSTGKTWTNTHYQLGAGIIGFVLTALPLFAVFIQTYQTNIQTALLSMFIIILSIVGIISRPRIDAIYTSRKGAVVPIAPLRSWYWKPLVAVIALYGIYFTGFALVGRKELSLLSITDPNQSIEFQLGSSVGQEIIFRYLVLGSILVASVSAFRNWLAAAIIALITSAFLFYGFHFGAFNLTTVADPVLLGNILAYIFISGLWLGGAYLATGSSPVVMFDHAWINTALLILRVILPGIASLPFPGLN